MTSQNNHVAEGQQVATFRGRMVSITVLELFSSDLDEFDRELREKMAQAPEFFRNAPLLLDFSQLQEDVDRWWLDRARRLMINNYFAPVGITGVNESLEYAAKTLDIAVWPSSGAVRNSTDESSDTSNDQEVEVQEEPAIPNESFVAEEEKAVPNRPYAERAMPSEHFSPPGQVIEKEPTILEESVESPDPVVVTEPAMPQTPPEPPAPVQEAGGQSQQVYAETLVIKQPIRSGQKVYAKGGDLLVLSSVSTGAEILADGHIHVYGTLRGRAIAGAQGNEEARIFCNDLQADLIAIAGFYTISDDIPEEKQKKAVQIYLRKEQLLIEPL
jgi:septum site-determining protein MinC